MDPRIEQPVIETHIRVISGDDLNEVTERAARMEDAYSLVIPDTLAVDTEETSD
jgi:hypothetical protein